MTRFIASFDGEQLAVHEMGELSGPTVILVHGLFSSAQVNWIKFGHAAKLAQAGFRVIMPELRAHGQSAAPHDASAYPQGVLSRDLAALVTAMELTEYDLVGFSLGSRTCARAVIDGLRPRRLVLSGMGLEGLAGWSKRADFFIDAIDRFDEIKRGDPAFMAKSFMKTMNVDRVAARQLLLAVDDTEADELAAITMPTMVLCGADDRDNGFAPDLADILPLGEYAEIPGTHMSSVAQGAMGDAILQFVGASE